MRLKSRKEEIKFVGERIHLESSRLLFTSLEGVCELGGPFLMYEV